MDIILDVQEKEVGEVKPPSLPSLKPGNSGFPEHKKRGRPSAFKAKRQAAAGIYPEPKFQSTRSRNEIAPKNAQQEDDERARIDKENRAKLQSMSEGEIEEAQRELLNDLDPSILQMLLRRANLDDTGDRKQIVEETEDEGATVVTGDTFKAGDRVVFEPPSVEEEEETRPSPPPEAKERSAKPAKKVTFDEDAAPSHIPDDAFPITSQPPPTNAHHNHQHNQTPSCNDPTHDHSHNSSDHTHFPTAQSVPDLDPSDPDFLANLHQKYFPSLPADPTKLSWMAPLPTPDSPADRDSPYHPAQSSLPVSALRFDFRGRLVPPSVARTLPSSLGLHHHAEAPEAAGYTIPELAHLCRSAVPAQRCLAFQTVGRVLYRLGKGEWGKGEGGRTGDQEGDDLAFSIWRLVKKGRVVESLEEAAGMEEGRGHRGVKVYATEALWLLEKGGWRERWRGL
jgi:hypothetical protein